MAMFFIACKECGGGRHKAECDQPGCDERIEAKGAIWRVKKDARKKDWMICEDGKTFCGAHRFKAYRDLEIRSS